MNWIVGLNDGMINLEPFVTIGIYKDDKRFIDYSDYMIIGTTVNGTSVLIANFDSEEYAAAYLKGLKKKCKARLILYWVKKVTG